MSDDLLKCQRCDNQNDDVMRRRQNTQYAEDESNFATLCSDCQKNEEEYWAERWAEYYAGCM